jgi:transcriptional regulator with XRE-family HTH domain
VEFKTWLAKKMKERDLNNLGLAIKLGMSSTSIGYWLSGRSVPDPDSCHKLAEFFSVPPETVLELVGHLEPVEPDLADERELVYLFRRLPESSKNTVMDMLRGLVDRLSRQEVDVEKIRRDRHIAYILRVLELATPGQRQKIMDEIRATVGQYQRELEGMEET